METSTPIDPLHRFRVPVHPNPLPTLWKDDFEVLWCKRGTTRRSIKGEGGRVHSERRTLSVGQLVITVRSRVGPKGKKITGNDGVQDEGGVCKMKDCPVGL